MPPQAYSKQKNAWCSKNFQDRRNISLSLKHNSLVLLDNWACFWSNYNCWMLRICRKHMTLWTGLKHRFFICVFLAESTHFQSPKEAITLPEPPGVSLTTSVRWNVVLTDDYYSLCFISFNALQLNCFWSPNYRPKEQPLRSYVDFQKWIQWRCQSM